MISKFTMYPKWIKKKKDTNLTTTETCWIINLNMSILMFNMEFKSYAYLIFPFGQLITCVINTFLISKCIGNKHTREGLMSVRTWNTP